MEEDKDFHLCHVSGKKVNQGVSDALLRLCENHIPLKQDSEKTATLSALQPKQHLLDEVYDKITAVHNSSVGQRGQNKCRAKLYDPYWTFRRLITWQYGQCQRNVLIIWSVPDQGAPLHLDYIGPLRTDRRVLSCVELFPTKTTTALKSASCIFQHM